MADTPTTQPAKKKTNPIIFIGIGCLVLIVFVGIVMSVIGGFLAKRVGTSLIQSAIESKTGVKANLQDIQNGKMTITDPKTGQTVNVGSGNLPDSFPKDFPVYPGAKIASSVSSDGNNNGYYITFTSTDSGDKVASYYKDSLKSNGWETQSTSTYGPLTTMAVSKGTMEGTVSISNDGTSKETGIIVTLGEKSE